MKVRGLKEVSSIQMNLHFRSIKTRKKSLKISQFSITSGRSPSLAILWARLYDICSSFLRMDLTVWSLIWSCLPILCTSRYIDFTVLTPHESLSMASETTLTCSLLLYSKDSLLKDKSRRCIDAEPNHSRKILSLGAGIPYT